MSSLSLKRASAASFAAHIAFILLMLLITKIAPFATPKIYTVKLVAPDEKAAAKKPVKAPVEAKVQPPRTSPPPKEKPEAKAAPEPSPPKPGPAPKAPSLDEYVSDKLSDLKAIKEQEEYLEEKTSRIESLRKLEQIRKLAASKGAEPATGQGGADKERTRVLEEYLGRVHDSIYAAWVFPEMDLKGLEATISITVMKSGRVVINRFESSSGNNLFDRSAIKAIQKASPVEPPPFGENMTIGVNFIPYVKK